MGAPAVTTAGAHPSGTPRGVATKRGLFDREIIGPAIVDSFKKLDPRLQIKNPVMFVVLIGTIVTFIESVAHPGIFDWSHHRLAVPHRDLRQLCRGGRRRPRQGTGGHVAEDALRDRRSSPGRRRRHGGARAGSVAAQGRPRRREANDLIPSDGEIVEGIASVDESAITGESAPVIRESGGDRSAVTGGTKCSPTESSCGSQLSRATRFSTG